MAAKVLMALLATSLTWGALELALRAWAPVAYMRPAGADPAGDGAGALPRELVHRASPIPGLAYELTPGSGTTYRGARLQVNEEGLRDDPSRAGADAPRFRIAAIGDSYTFGQGVESSETWPNQLERGLNTGHPGEPERGLNAGHPSERERGPHQRPFEVLNFGVGGYSSRDEALVLEYKALALNPSLVVVGYVLNDPEIDAVQPLHRSFRPAAWWQHWELLRLTAWQHRQWNVRLHGGGDYLRYLHAPDRPKWKTVEQAFTRMAELATDNSVPVLVAVFPVVWVDRWDDYDYADLHAQVVAAARARGLSAVDLLPAFRAHPIDDVRLTQSDPHPSALGQAAAAGAIQIWIEAHEPAWIETHEPALMETKEPDAPELDRGGS